MRELLTSGNSISLPSPLGEGQGGEAPSMRQTVSKSEMGLRYFPQLTKNWARVKLIDYLSGCPEWHPGRDFKRRRYFTAAEVRQVEKIMG